ncbi:MauE/DoxX family redox-associated membrane protein [Plantactinospora sp. CA-294935]|uniref:MauE/DoxX family redox-associated membrane protein n=1 Tax=Plantactinospora sp. CA-294935 TaxID=3240012 RepID=UPI003D8EAF44
MAYLGIGCGVLLAVVFGWSTASRLRSRRAFGEFAGSLTPLVRRTGAVAVLLTVVEALVPPLLLVAPAWGFGLATGLLAVLAAGVLLVVRRRLDVRCRCFGNGSARLGVRHVVRNLLLFLVAGTGLLAALSAGAAPPVDGPGVLLSAGAAAILATFVVHLDDLVELWA